MRDLYDLTFKRQQRKRCMAKRLVTVIVVIATIAIGLIALISFNKADKAKANAYVATATYRIKPGDNLHVVARACGSEATDDSVINVIYQMNDEYFAHHSVDGLAYGDIITVPVY